MPSHERGITEERIRHQSSANDHRRIVGFHTFLLKEIGVANEENNENR